MDSTVDSLIESVDRLNISQAPKSTPRSKAASESIKPWLRRDLKTGLIFDDSMTQHKCLWCKADECPERYECIRDRFAHYNLTEQCELLKSRQATPEEILLAHDKEYFESLKATKGQTDVEKLKSFSEKYDGVYINEHTFDIAMLAAGSAIELADAVIDGSKIKNGFALIRTPGHHAQRAEPNGYCFFNNAAIVAKHCRQNRNTKRVLIIDWDVHHGQGTQYAFYDDPNVFYVSIHRYEKGRYWPELIESNFNFTGQGSGKGFNLNLPLNETGCNDADFLLMWFNVILPIAYEFNPELVIISAGYDAAIGCPEGKMRVKPITYHVLCQSLMALANGKMVVLLEGGYNLLSLAEGAAMTLRALLGYPCAKLDESFIELAPHNSVVQTILDSIWALRPQWKMLHLQGSFERFKPDSGTSHGGDVDMRPKYAPVATYEGTNINLDTKPDKYELDGVSCPKDEAQQAAVCEEIKSIISRTDLSLPQNYLSKRTLLIFDDQMVLHKCPTSHPEKPERYISIKKRLQDYGLYDRCIIGKSRAADEDEILRVHSESLLEMMKKTPTMSAQKLIELGNTMDSIYINQSTYKCALLAAGCAIEAVDKVMNRTCSNAFALIRPPGHHASQDTPSGFCFFNNVVVAAKYALENYKDTCKRVLIVDYDFHHGNGVQRMVQDDDSILYISLHGYDDANEYPMEQMSNYNTGSKNIINIPWNDDRMGDSEYIMAYLSIVLPCVYEFNPDLVLISSGFDAAINDPLGRYKVSPAAYGHFVHHLLPLASGKLVACLEGGYNLNSISESAAHVVSILLGDPPQSLQLKPPSEAAILSMKNVISYHKSNYKLLCFDYDLPSDQVE